MADRRLVATIVVVDVRDGPRTRLRKKDEVSQFMDRYAQQCSSSKGVIGGKPRENSIEKPEIVW